jgi:hypothetical protein
MAVAHGTGPASSVTTTPSVIGRSRVPAVSEPSAATTGGGVQVALSPGRATRTSVASSASGPAASSSASRPWSAVRLAGVAGLIPAGSAPAGPVNQTCQRMLPSRPSTSATRPVGVSSA